MTLYVVITSSSSPLVYNSFSVFPCFWWPCHVRLFCTSLSSWIYLMFSHYDLRLSVFWKECHRGEVSISYHIISVQSTWLITGKVDLDHLVKVASTRSLHCKVTFHFCLLQFSIENESPRTAPAQVLPLSIFNHQFVWHKTYKNGGHLSISNVGK